MNDQHENRHQQIKKQVPTQRFQHRSSDMTGSIKALLRLQSSDRHAHRTSQ